MQIKFDIWFNRTHHAYIVNNYASKLKTVSVVGARGYSGLELVKLLLKHESVKLTHCFATQEFSLDGEIFDSTVKSVVCLKDSELMKNLTDIVFLATPPEVSTELAPQIIKARKKVIDLSHAFRGQAEYGLVPFVGPVKPETQLIANPGCYATAISLALIPLVKNGLIDLNHIVIDAKSGTTGAGKKASENLLFSEVDGECRPYRVGQHQHLPEIHAAVERWGGSAVDLHMSTHLLPTKRGISAAIYATAKTENIAEIANAYNKTFADYPLVQHGSNLEKLASLSKVVGTPRTHISYELIEKKLYVFSLIDNLLKGAASQAVENLNRFLDLQPSTHLL